MHAKEEKDFGKDYEFTAMLFYLQDKLIIFSITPEICFNFSI